MTLHNNLDYSVAEAAMKFEPQGEEKATDNQNAVQKAISVLSSQGLFAMFLWSYAKKDYKFVAERFVKIFTQHQLMTCPQEPPQAVLNALKVELCNLPKIRFLEDLTMRILIYARHYLKSKE